MTSGQPPNSAIRDRITLKLAIGSIVIISSAILGLVSIGILSPPRIEPIPHLGLNPAIIQPGASPVPADAPTLLCFFKPDTISIQKSSLEGTLLINLVPGNGRRASLLDQDKKTLPRYGFQIDNPAQLYPGNNFEVTLNNHVITVPTRRAITTGLEVNNISVPLERAEGLDYGQSFPNDGYHFSIHISAVVSDLIWYRPTIGSQAVAATKFNLEIPPTLTEFPDLYLKSLNQTTYRDTSGTSISIEGSLQRPLSFILFIYGVSLSPALIILAFSISVFRRSLHKNGLPLELAAACLALLALRQVLVPNDVPGMNRVDKILALEAVATVAIIALTHTRHEVHQEKHVFPSEPNKELLSEPRPRPRSRLARAGSGLSRPRVRIKVAHSRRKDE